MTDQFRAMCAELLAWAEHTSSHYYKQPDVLDRARALLAQPVAEGPTDKELRGVFVVNGAWPGGLRAVADLAADRARHGRPTPQPVAVSERLPGPEDCIKRGNDHWCWGQERSLLTGQASARWRLMRVSALTDEAVNWLPANALPTPTQ